MNRSTCTALALALIPAALLPAQETRRPNIVFLLADDLGWRDTSLYGSCFYETPNIDRLAKRGMRFTDAYAANPLCSPTRASILTGQHPGRLRLTVPGAHLKEVVLDPVVPEKAAPSSKWVLPQSRTRLPLDYYTLAEALRDAGYATAHLGKWHLGWEPYQPESQGFGFNLPGGSFPGPPGGYFAPFRVDTLSDCPPGEHVDDRLTREAIRFLKEHRDKPFFLNYWLFSVHAPYQAKEDLIARYEKKVDPQCPQQSPTMGGMIHTLDQCIGRILDAIDSLGLAENTIIVFTSDNGGNMYDRVDGTTPTNNHPLKGGKATIYEGGVRVPLVVTWPGHVQPGSVSEAMVSSIDYYPTVLEMLGLKPKPGLLLDGTSIVPALRGEPLQRDALFCHFPHAGVEPARFPSTSVRQGDWKLIRAYCDGPDQTDRFELYNLRNDLGETENLADKMPDKVVQMNTLINNFLEETGSLVPRPNPAYRPPVDGWWGSPDAAVSAAGGLMRVKATGGDPQITTQDVPAVAEAATLQLRMRSQSNREGRAYWATREHRAFHRDRSTVFEVRHDGQWHEYEVQLNIQGPLTSLRIDPSQAPGEIEIEWIRLRGSDGEVLRQWDFKQ